MKSTQFHFFHSTFLQLTWLFLICIFISWTIKAGTNVGTGSDRSWLPPRLEKHRKKAKQRQTFPCGDPSLLIITSSLVPPQLQERDQTQLWCLHTLSCRVCSFCQKCQPYIFLFLSWSNSRERKILYRWQETKQMWARCSIHPVYMYILFFMSLFI